MGYFTFNKSSSSGFAFFSGASSWLLRIMKLTYFPNFTVFWLRTLFHILKVDFFCFLCFVWNNLSFSFDYCIDVIINCFIFKCYWDFLLSLLILMLKSIYLRWSWILYLWYFLNCLFKCDNWFIFFWGQTVLLQILQYWPCFCNFKYINPNVIFA